MQDKETMMTKAEQDTKRGDLAQTRERLRELAARFPEAEREVRLAAEKVDLAKLVADLKPNDGAARETGEHEALRLDNAILDRDKIAESIERLRKHEEGLAFELAAVDGRNRGEARAAAIAALPGRIRELAPTAREFAALVQLHSELEGRQVADLGLLVLEYLSGEFTQSGRSFNPSIAQVHAEVARMRAALDRGEVP